MAHSVFSMSVASGPAAHEFSVLSRGSPYKGAFHEIRRSDTACNNPAWAGTLSALLPSEPSSRGAPEQVMVITPRGRWALQWRPMRVVATGEHKWMACARTFLESD
jgi:hypothetical protein